MPILNYTTEVSASRTANELSALLSGKGAKRVSIDYDGQGDPVAIEFMIILTGLPVNFRLPCNVDGVYQALASDKNVERKYRNRAHAQRVAWRIVKDWVASQLAIVQAKQAEMSEVFLPYAIDANGQTFYQAFRESHQKQLSAAASQVL